MNTSEINGGNWQTAYFFAAAIPLAVVTVLIPLLIIPNINFLLRQYQDFEVALKRTAIAGTFIFFVITDALWYIYDDIDSLDYTTTSSEGLGVLSMLLAIWLFILCVARKYLDIRQILRRRKSVDIPPAFNASNRALYIRIGFSGFACFCFFFGLCYEGVELLPYLIYFGFKIRQWWQAKKTQDRKRTSTSLLEAGGR